MKYIFIFFTLILKSFLVYSEVFTVLKIHDDSSITVKYTESASAFRIILACVDIPDLKQDDWGQLALKRLRNLVQVNSEVTLNIGEDLYKRKTADLFTSDGTNIAEKLLSEGLVALQPIQNGCNESYQSKLNEAISKKIGVWSDDDFMLPFIFRQNLKE